MTTKENSEEAHHWMVSEHCQTHAASARTTKKSFHSAGVRQRPLATNFSCRLLKLHQFSITAQEISVS